MNRPFPPKQFPYLLKEEIILEFIEKPDNLIISFPLLASVIIFHEIFIK